jgi:DNA-directed RNA polymerase sigma subunit (sigma70/sigma32)
VLEEDGDDNFTHHVQNEVLEGIKRERDILRTLTHRETNGIRYRFGKNCPVKISLKEKWQKR